MLPRTQHVDSDGCAIAYQVLGEGPDLLFVPGLVSHLDLHWSDPVFADALRRLASFSRLIILDHRGIGLSDPAPGVARLDQRVADMRAVLDAVGSQRATLLGHCNGGPASLLFAATYPERVTSMAICSSFAKGRPDDGHPGALSVEAHRLMADAVEHWGEGRSLRLYTASTAGGRWHERMYGVFERASQSPAMARASVRSTLEIDVTDILPTVRTPTIVIHCTGDFMSVENARYIAEHVPGARFVEIDGSDHFPFAGTRSDEYLDVIEELVTGRRGASDGTFKLRSVLFTDIVGSTEHAAAVGDRAWLDLIARHDLVVANVIEHFAGRQVKSTGDGALAAFESPESAIRAALAIRGAVGELGLRTRAGVHIGPCELYGEDLVGLTVHVAARIADLAAPGELLVSAAVRKLSAGAAFVFSPRDEVTLKGVPGHWRLFAAEISDEPALMSPTWTAEDKPGDRAASWRARILIRVARDAPWLARSALRMVGGSAPG